MALHQERLGEGTSLEHAMGIRSSLGFHMWKLKLAYEEAKGSVVRNAGAAGDQQEDSRPCPNAPWLDQSLLWPQLAGGRGTPHPISANGCLFGAFWTWDFGELGEGTRG